MQNTYLFQSVVLLIFNWYHGAVLILFVLLMGLLPTHSFAQPKANGKSKFLRCSIRSVRSNFINYRIQVTPENAGKWASVEGSQDQYNWTPLDNNYVITNSFPYKHHALI